MVAARQARNDGVIEGQCATGEIRSVVMFCSLRWQLHCADWLRQNLGTRMARLKIAPLKERVTKVHGTFTASFSPE